MRLPGMRRMRGLANRLRTRGPAGSVILMYHRIADLDADPWGLAVSPAHFAEHLGVLRRHATISLRDLVHASGRGAHPRGAVVVTFDDGYADNVETALPLLLRQRIPATVFLTTEAVGAQREFWWDELGRVLLEARPLPAMLELQRDGFVYRQALDANAMAGAGVTGHRTWRAWQEPPTLRHRMYYELWQWLYPLTHGRRRAVLDDLLEWAGLEPLVRDTHRLVSLADAQRLGEEPLIEVGAHTVTHPPLTTVDDATRDYEIRESKRVLEAMVKQEVGSFAYPHGDHDSATVSAVRAAGFTSACTTAAGTASAGAGLLTLPRFQVLDWSGDELSARLHEWQHAPVAT